MAKKYVIPMVAAGTAAAKVVMAAMDQIQLAKLALELEWRVHEIRVLVCAPGCLHCALRDRCINPQHRTRWN